MAKQPSQATQQLIDVEEVRNGVIILKNGGLRQILLVSGMNFDLKSEEEQSLITYSYQNFLNSLDFSIQFFIHSRKLNTDAYLAKLSARLQEESNELLRNQIVEYQEFIKSFVSQNAIMDKTFFAVVPFDPVAVPQVAAGISEKVFGFLKKKGAPSPQVSTDKERQIEMGFNQLSQRVGQVLSNLNSIGLGAVSLNTDEVIELYYNLYNPEAIEKRGLTIGQNQNQQ